jgi:hypothetical protein
VSRYLKPAAAIVLLAFISPSLLAVSNCIGKNAVASRCQPSCPMMELKTDASDQVSATPREGSCCNVSSRPLVTNQAAIVPQVWITGNVPLVVSACDISLPPDRLIRLQETAPPVCISSHQALLCTFLV